MDNTTTGWLKYELEHNHGDSNRLYIDWNALDAIFNEAKDMEQNRMLDLIMFIRKNDRKDKSAYDLYQDFVNGKDLVDEGPEYDGAGFTENDRMATQETKTQSVIQLLKSMDVDGETMQYILKQVGMEYQMLRQLMLTMPSEQVEYLMQEQKDLF